jgi:excinuclease UvrABC nuclease subunit
MIGNYVGNYAYNTESVSLLAPSSLGVYYCGTKNINGLTPYYIGRSENIQERLQDHLRDDYWPGVTHFGYRTCSTWSEMVELEASEIRRFQPQYNAVGKSF